MKSTSFALVAMIFLVGTSSFSQTNDLKEKYEKGLESARKKMGETSYRVIGVNKYYSNRTIEGICNIVEEYVSDKENSSIMSSEKPFDRCGYSKITVGGDSYTRILPGGWTKDTKEGEAGMAMRENVLTVQGERYTPKEVNSYRITPDKVGNENATLYFHYLVIELKDGLSFLVSYDWINEKGLIIKTYTRSSFAVPDNVFSETTETYEYNPKDLKIKAPVIN